MRRTTGAAAVLWLAAAAGAWAQDQQLGARTKAMGGSYTAFEDDPVSVWLNPAGTATQPDSGALVYQTYTTYTLTQSVSGVNTVFESEAEVGWNDPGILPSYLGLVFQVGSPEAPLAVGFCYAQPYRLNYTFDHVTDPFDTDYEPDSNVNQYFSRFRLALAKDFRLRPAGETGWLTHVSAGLGLDLGLERWEFRSTTATSSDSDAAFGFGLGGLLGLYDDGESLRINVGLAYQSAVHWNFDVAPEIQPAFDMPQQLNVGLTFYLLEKTPLRVTLDFQWLEWSETAEDPRYSFRPGFEDAVNFSVGLEYRLDAGGGLTLYPRLGFRRFDAPWEDENDLPMTSDYQLVLDTKGGEFNIATFGLGLSWAGADGKLRSVDVGGDVGGDTVNFAVGLTYEF
jgi:long-subunit fatty acid transport protein